MGASLPTSFATLKLMYLLLNLRRKRSNPCWVFQRRRGLPEPLTMFTDLLPGHLPRQHPVVRSNLPKEFLLNLRELRRSARARPLLLLVRLDLANRLLLLNLLRKLKLRPTRKRLIPRSSRQWKWTKLTSLRSANA